MGQNRSKIKKFLRGRFGSGYDKYWYFTNRGVYVTCCGNKRKAMELLRLQKRDRRVSYFPKRRIRSIAISYNSVVNIACGAKFWFGVINGAQIVSYIHKHWRADDAIGGIDARGLKFGLYDKKGKTKADGEARPSVVKEKIWCSM